MKERTCSTSIFEKGAKIIQHDGLPAVHRHGLLELSKVLVEHSVVVEQGSDRGVV